MKGGSGRKLIFNVPLIYFEGYRWGREGENGTGEKICEGETE